MENIELSKSVIKLIRKCDSLVALLLKRNDKKPQTWVLQEIAAAKALGKVVIILSQGAQYADFTKNLIGDSFIFTFPSTNYKNWHHVKNDVIKKILKEIVPKENHEHMYI